jgi:hypothetical protein
MTAVAITLVALVVDHSPRERLFVRQPEVTVAEQNREWSLAEYPAVSPARACFFLPSGFELLWSCCSPLPMTGLVSRVHFLDFDLG